MKLTTYLTYIDGLHTLLKLHTRRADELSFTVVSTVESSLQCPLATTYALPSLGADQDRISEILSSQIPFPFPLD